MNGLRRKRRRLECFIENVQMIFKEIENGVFDCQINQFVLPLLIVGSSAVYRTGHMCRWRPEISTPISLETCCSKRHAYTTDVDCALEKLEA